MRYFSRSALIALLVSALAVAGLGLTSGPAAAAEPDPTLQDTARLLGYMWGDGSLENGVWDVNGPSGTSSLIEALVEEHGGTWVDRGRLKFRLPAAYDWSDWKHGLPDDTPRVSSAVLNPNFLAALLETEASVGGQVYDQSICCVPGYTRGRLTELRDMLRDRGYATAKFVEFNNVDSGKVTIGQSEWGELRAAHRFACPTSQDVIRIPGGTDLNQYGNLRWIRPATTWGSLVRGDCLIGSAVPTVGTQVGSCSVSAEGNEVTVDWTFTLGDAAIRSDGKYVTTVSGRDGSWSQTRADGEYNYEVRLIAFGVKTTVNCGIVSVPGDGGPPPAGPCVSVASGNQVQVSWDDFGKNRYSVRRNGSWVATITDGAQSIVLDGSVNDTWELRYSDDGQRTTIPCPAADDPLPIDPCTVVGAAVGVRVSWDAVDGVTKYQLRRNGSWLATIAGATSFEDSEGALGDAYTVRYRHNGVRTDIPCT